MVFKLPKYRLPQTQNYHSAQAIKSMCIINLLKKGYVENNGLIVNCFLGIGRVLGLDRGLFFLVYFDI